MKRIYDRFVGDVCRRSGDFLDSRGPRRAFKARISAYGSKTTGNGSAEYAGGRADSNRSSAPQSRCCNIFATGAGVIFSQLATDIRAIGDTSRQTRLAGLIDTDNLGCRRNGKRKSDALATCTALLSVTM